LRNSYALEKEIRVSMFITFTKIYKVFNRHDPRKTQKQTKSKSIGK